MSALFLAGEWIISGRYECIVPGWGMDYFRPGSALFVSGWGVDYFRPERVLLRVGECKRCFKLGTAFFKA
jgi:hypothetical protein